MVKKSNKALPLVTIVLPVYNEELFIRETLESILAQDYENIEILISDNHSSDATASLCIEFARRDQRIQFFEQSSNIGAIANHSFLASKAKGKDGPLITFQPMSRHWKTILPQYCHTELPAGLMKKACHLNVFPAGMIRGG